MTAGERADADSARKTARLAGLLYLLIGIAGPIGWMYVPSVLFAPGNATATADHIRASPSLLRVGIASELFGQTIVIFLVLALYRLFRGIDATLASLVVILGALVEVPIVFVNVLNEIAALVLVSGASFLSVFDKPQLDALAYLFIRLHGQGLVIAEIFWGLWLFPFGILAIRSRFMPRVLGVLLMVAGSGWLVSSFTWLLLPTFAHRVDQFAMVLGMGELPMMAWLLIRGAKTPPSGAGASSSAIS
jgi:Domain of unknown function (DUF4386)